MGTAANWTREQLLPALVLYHQLRFGQLDSRTPSIVALASKLGRTPGSVAMKLNNFASLDPVLKARGISGLRGASSLDRQVWGEFEQNREAFVERYQPEVEAAFQADGVAPSAEEDHSSDDVWRTTKTRKGQQFFRRMVLTDYANACCMTGLAEPKLLIASHIVPWNADPAHRLDPANGLCLSTLHDRAFDAGLITVLPDYRIAVSDHIRQHAETPIVKQWLVDLHGQEIRKPEKSWPSKEFLEYHNTKVFLGRSH